jgi:hypothetical protein
VTSESESEGEGEGEGEEWQKPSTLPARLSTFLSGKIIGGKVIF